MRRRPGAKRQSQAAALAILGLSSLPLSNGCYSAFHLRVPRPPPPVAYACGVIPTGLIFPGDPITVTGTAEFFNPAKALSYVWTLNGHPLPSHSNVATIATKSLSPGTYTVQGHISVGSKPGESADCQTQFTVNAFEPPTVSCSASPAAVVDGSPSTITAIGISPQSRPLVYSFTSTRGSITARGPTATLETGSVPGFQGRIVVSCNAADDLGQAASASASVMVFRPPSPSSSSLYFQTQISGPALPPPPAPPRRTTLPPVQSVVGRVLTNSANPSATTPQDELGNLTNDAPSSMTLNQAITIDAAIRRGSSPPAVPPPMTPDIAANSGLAANRPLNSQDVPVADQMIVTLRPEVAGEFNVTPAIPGDSPIKTLQPGGHAEWHWSVTPLLPSKNPTDKKRLVLHSEFVTHADGVENDIDQGSTFIIISVTVLPWYQRIGPFLHEHWIGMLGWLLPSSGAIFAWLLKKWRDRKNAATPGANLP